MPLRTWNHERGDFDSSDVDRDDNNDSERPAIKQPSPSPRKTSPSQRKANRAKYLRTTLARYGHGPSRYFENRVLVFADEAFWGDRASADKMKSKVTETRLLVNKKNLPQPDE